jgi:hypothetical protein
MANIRDLLAIALVTGTLAADAPYIGKWKFNPTKSELTGDTCTIENVAGGMMQFSTQGFTYKFKLDGTEYPMPDGGTTSWTVAAPNTWDVRNRMNGKVTAAFHLAVKGDTMSVTIRQMKPEGGSVDATSTYTRVSGGPGFLGKWKSTEVKMPSLMVELSANDPDGLTYQDETGFIVNAKFDGKDYPAGGKMTGAKYTFSLKRLGDRSFEMSGKLDGKPFYVDVFTVSADGKTLTDKGTPVNAKEETTKAVYDRQ